MLPRVFNALRSREKAGTEHGIVQERVWSTLGETEWLNLHEKILEQAARFILHMASK